MLCLSSLLEIQIQKSQGLKAYPSMNLSRGQKSPVNNRFFRELEPPAHLTYMIAQTYKLLAAADTYVKAVFQDFGKAEMEQIFCFKTGELMLSFVSPSPELSQM